MSIRNGITSNSNINLHGAESERERERKKYTYLGRNTVKVSIKGLL